MYASKQSLKNKNHFGIALNAQCLKAKSSLTVNTMRTVIWGLHVTVTDFLTAGAHQTLYSSLISAAAGEACVCVCVCRAVYLFKAASPWS